MKHYIVKCYGALYEVKGSRLSNGDISGKYRVLIFSNGDIGDGEWMENGMFCNSDFVEEFVADKD